MYHEQGRQRRRLVEDSAGLVHMRRTLNASIDEVYYLASRLVATVVLIGLFFLLPTDVIISRSAMGAGVVACLVGWLLIAIATHRGRVTDAMMEVLVIDLIGVGALIYALDTAADEAYPLLIGLSVLYGLTQPKLRAGIAAGALAFAYLIGQAAVADGDIRPMRMVMIALGGLALVLVGFLVASAVERRRNGERLASAASARAGLMKDELERRISELQTLKRISEAVHSSLELDVMGPAVLQIIAEWLGIGTCSLFVIDRQTRESIMTADWGYVDVAPASVPVVERSDFDASSDEAFACLTIFENASVRVVLCADPDDLTKVSEHDRGMLSTACSEMVVAADNSRLYQLTKRLSVTDELTGLYNYRYLQKTLESEIDRARRYPSSLSFIMFDIDDFKRFNDAHGHVAGDQVLGEVGRLVRGVVRDVDVVARYGGEEFSVILPETSAHGAYVVAEKIRVAIEQHTFSDAAGVVVDGLTVSIGLATFPTHAWDKEALLREADNALYHAKNGGKNRIRTPQVVPIAGLADAISSARTGE